MSVTLILQAIVAILKFPEEMRKFILLLQKSPEEKRQEINKAVDQWMQESSESDRPVWEK